MNDATIYIVRKCIAVVYSSVQCSDCCSKHLPACSRLADWWSEHEWVRWWDPPGSGGTQQLQLIPEGLQICGRRTWRSCPSPDHKAASCARDPGELMCHRQLARSLPRVERRCRFLLMERSSCGSHICPHIWPAAGASSHPFTRRGFSTV